MEEKVARKVSTVFENKSGTEVKSAVLKLVGQRDSFKYSLTSIVSDNNNKFVKLVFDLSELYNQLNKYNLTDKLEAKISKKFESYETLELNSSDNQFTVSFTFNDTEIISSSKEAIKYLKMISKFTKTLSSINDYYKKMIEKKELKIQELAKKKAQKASIMKEAAEAIVESESFDPAALV